MKTFELHKEDQHFLANIICCCASKI